MIYLTPEDLEINKKEAQTIVTKITEKLDKKIDSSNVDPRFINPLSKKLPIRRNTKWPEWNSNGSYSWSIAYENGFTISTGQITLNYFPKPKKLLEILTEKASRAKHILELSWNNSNPKIDTSKPIFEVIHNEDLVTNNVEEAINLFLFLIDKIRESRNRSKSSPLQNSQQ